MILHPVSTGQDSGVVFKPVTLLVMEPPACYFFSKYGPGIQTHRQVSAQ
jgi:hypothetical protein